MQNLLDSLDTYLAAGSLLSYAAVYVGGVLISFTPCIYPVIPITVGYIGGRSQGTRSRGFFLSLSYVLGMAMRRWAPSRRRRARSSVRWRRIP